MAGLETVQQQVNSKKLALRENPNLGTGPRGVTPDMITLIAKQQIAKEQAEKEQALNAAMQEPQGTISEQLDGQILESQSKQLTNNIAGVVQNNQAKRQQPQNMQARRPMPGQNPAQPKQPMPPQNPANMMAQQQQQQRKPQGGLPIQQKPMMVAQGGIIPKFQDGGRIEGLKARIRKALQQLGPGDASDPERQSALRDILNVVTRGGTAEENKVARELLMTEAGFEGTGGAPSSEKPKSTPGKPDTSAAGFYGDLFDFSTGKPKDTSKKPDGAPRSFSAYGAPVQNLSADGKNLDRLKDTATTLGGLYGGRSAIGALGKTKAGQQAGKFVADKGKKVLEKGKDLAGAGVDKAKDIGGGIQNVLRKGFTESRNRRQFPNAKVGKTANKRITKAGSRDEVRDFSGRRTAQTLGTGVGLGAVAARGMGASEVPTNQPAQTTPPPVQGQGGAAPTGPRKVQDMGGLGVLRPGATGPQAGGATGPTPPPAGGTPPPAGGSQVGFPKTEAPDNPIMSGLQGIKKTGADGKAVNLADIMKDRALADPTKVRDDAALQAKKDFGYMDKDGKSTTGDQRTIAGLADLYDKQEKETARQLTPAAQNDKFLARMYAARAGAAGAARGNSILDFYKGSKEQANEKIQNYNAIMKKQVEAVKQVNEEAGKAFDAAVESQNAAATLFGTVLGGDITAANSYLDREAANNRAALNAEVQLRLGKDVNELKAAIQETNKISSLVAMMKELQVAQAETIKTLNGETRMSSSLSKDEKAAEMAMNRVDTVNRLKPLFDMISNQLLGKPNTGDTGGTGGTGDEGGKQVKPTDAAASALSQYGGNMGQFGI